CIKKYKNIMIRIVIYIVKQCVSVVNIIGNLTINTFIVVDSAKIFKYNGDFIYNAEIENQKAKEIIDTIREIDDTQTILACSETGAYVLDNISESEKKHVHGSYQHVNYIKDYNDIAEDLLKITVHRS